MRWRGLEPPRPARGTRPSTLRVYQFRHQRSARRMVAANRRHGGKVPVTLRRVRDLCERAVEAALASGASYADARVVTRRSQHVLTKNGRVELVNDVETEGIGVRVLAGGA